MNGMLPEHGADKALRKQIKMLIFSQRYFYSIRIENKCQIKMHLFEYKH